jgi:hypothetical protein
MELVRFGCFVGRYVAKSILATNVEHHMIPHQRLPLPYPSFVPLSGDLESRCVEKLWVASWIRCDIVEIGDVQNRR